MYICMFTVFSTVICKSKYQSTPSQELHLYQMSCAVRGNSLQDLPHVSVNQINPCATFSRLFDRDMAEFSSLTRISASAEIYPQTSTFFKCTQTFLFIILFNVGLFHRKKYVVQHSHLTDNHPHCQAVKSLSDTVLKSSTISEMFSIYGN
jgi:hypothetical protein